MEAIKTISVGEFLGHDTSNAKPAEIGNLLARIKGYCVFIMDEFDKASDKATKAAFADLIKILSDNAPSVTLIIVGVSKNIHELVGEHPSIDRNLVQIDIPTMTDEEITTIIDSGFAKLRIQPQNGVVAHVPSLAGGYPHYAHLLGLCAAKACAQNETALLTHDLFTIACNLAVADAIEKYRDTYAQATMTTQASRYPIILCGCGYARCDARGVFRATDVVDAVRDVFNIQLTIQAVVPALGEFLSANRGKVLEPVPVSKRKCYRLADPMMRPFLRLKSREVLGAL